MQAAKRDTIPTAFIVGLSGQFYKQFALTIAISTVISAFNSLTLSPALAALLLKPHGAKKDRFTRGIDFVFGWFFKLFNRFFGRASRGYGKLVTHTLRSSSIALVVYAGLIALTIFGFSRVPTGFVPTQDKGYLVSFAQLPNGATLPQGKLARPCKVSSRAKFPHRRSRHFSQRCA